jgi:hypothetical protein
MKKYFIFGICFSFVFAHKTMAQETRFGARGSLLISSFRVLQGNVSGNFTSNTGFAGGLFVDFPIANSIHLQPAVEFAIKGGTSPDLLKYSISYLEVPINVFWKGDLGNGKLYCGAGPYIAFALGGSVSRNGQEESLKFGGTANDDLEVLDFGMNMHVGYEFDMGFTAGLKYDLGFTNINSIASSAIVRNRAFAISVGFLF